MIKKALMGIGLLALGSYLWMGTSIGSYARTGYNQSKSYFQGQVPVEFEIKRARQLVSELVPDIRTTMKTIAEEEVKIQRLAMEIAKMEENLGAERDAIVALKNELGKGLASYRIGSVTVSQQALRNDLNRRFNGYQRADGILQSKREILESQQAHLTATKDKYENLVQSKQELETELAALESKHSMVEAKKIENRTVVDDSRLSRVRQLIDNINDRLEVEIKLSESDGKLLREIRTEDIPPVDLESQIDDYFGERADDSKSAI